jgi:hypothetical protein
MNQGTTFFAQLMSMIPESEFDKCVYRFYREKAIFK